MNKEKLKTAVSLFGYFFYISWVTFGGGWSIVAQIEKDYVAGKKKITSEELLDIVSVGRSLPGTMVGNVAYLFGYHLAGVPGALLAMLGMILPPMMILCVLTFCYGQVRDAVWAQRLLVGVRAAVVPIIGIAMKKLATSAFPNRLCYIVAAGAFLLSAVMGMNCALVIVLGIVCGILMGKFKEGKK